METGLPVSPKAEPTGTMAAYVAASLRRLEEARGVAQSLLHDAELHRLAMRAVFVLEDCHEMLARFSAPCDIEIV